MMSGKKNFILATAALLPVASRALSTATTDGLAKGKVIVKTEQVPGLAKGMDYVRLGDSDLTVSNICMGYVDNPGL